MGNKQVGRTPRHSRDAVPAHPHHEDHPWTMWIAEHPPRTASPAYTKSRALMNKLARSVKNFVLGKPPYEDHHGGGLWLKDEEGWFLVRNLAGMEWVSQFCADPKKVEAVKELKIEKLLDTPIKDSAGVAEWTDSICNASVPLSQPLHTGTLPKAGSVRGQVTGVHHYPGPVVEIQLFKRRDYPLWVSLDGVRHAVAPVSEPGSGDGRVRVLASEVIAEAPTEPTGEGRPAGRALRDLGVMADLENYRTKEGDVVLPADHPISRAAFAEQDREIAAGRVSRDDPLYRFVST
jgi:hypothetical protein